jgi:hypothetical protein
MNDAAGFGATVAGFAAGDTIDLLNVAATSATINAGDQLMVWNGAATAANLQLTGDYTGAAFSVTSDGAGGSDVTVSFFHTAHSLQVFAAASAALAAPDGGSGGFGGALARDNPRLSPPICPSGNDTHRATAFGV